MTMDFFENYFPILLYSCLISGFFPIVALHTSPKFTEKAANQLMLFSVKFV